jgi:hypothetical protein
LAELFHSKITKGALNGEANGLSILIDVESYNLGSQSTGKLEKDFWYLGIRDLGKTGTQPGPD